MNETDVSDVFYDIPAESPGEQAIHAAFAGVDFLEEKCTQNPHVKTLGQLQAEIAKSGLPITVSLSKDETVLDEEPFEVRVNGEAYSNYICLDEAVTTVRSLITGYKMAAEKMNNLTRFKNLFHDYVLNDVDAADPCYVRDVLDQIGCTDEDLKDCGLDCLCL